MVAQESKTRRQKARDVMLQEIEQARKEAEGKLNALQDDLKRWGPPLLARFDAERAALDVEFRPAIEQLKTKEEGARQALQVASKAVWDAEHQQRVRRKEIEDRQTKEAKPLQEDHDASKAKILAEMETKAKAARKRHDQAVEGA